MATLNIPYSSRPLATFSQLPAEIRVEIFKHLFNGTKVSLATALVTKQLFNPAHISSITNILRVSRCCYIEAKPIFYDRAIFHLKSCSVLSAASINDYGYKFIQNTDPSTADIRDLVITPGPQSTCSHDELDRTFPGLRKVWFNIYGGIKIHRGLSQPSTGKQRLAKCILQNYTAMCELNLDHFEAKAHDDSLWRTTLELYHEEIYDIMEAALGCGFIGPKDYKIVLQTDLTDTLPWIIPQTRAADALCRALRQTGGRLIGVYSLATQEWRFDINGKRVTIPEPIFEDLEDDSEEEL